MYPDPGDPLKWGLALELRRLEADNKLNVADIRFPTGSFAWLYMHAASQVLRDIILCFDGDVYVARHNNCGVITTTPGSRVCVLMQQFSWAQHIPPEYSRGKENAVVKAKLKCNCQG